MNKKQLINELKKQKFSDKIVGAFEKVDRSFFVPGELRPQAYQDMPLPIGEGQTISQPYTIAFMLSILDVQDKQKILEIGSGSGYVLALLAELNKNGKIVGIERIKKLAENSKEKIPNKNVEIFHKDATKNLDEKFDRILVSAAFDEMPQKIINKNLNFGGKMVVPIKDSLFLIEKKSGQNKVTEFPGFVFVPVLEGEA